MEGLLILSVLLISAMSGIITSYLLEKAEQLKTEAGLELLLLSLPDQDDVVSGDKQKAIDEKEWKNIKKNAENKIKILRQLTYGLPVALLLLYPFFWLIRFVIWAVKTLRDN